MSSKPFYPAELFHPAVCAWFTQTFAAATACQQQAWPAIKQGRHTLITAPTGSGKTLAAFLSAIDDLIRLGSERGFLEDQTQVLYVSPLKALSNDIDKNLQQPISGTRNQFLSLGLPDIEITTAVRTGDTTPGDREKMRRKPPHILVTTPESFYIMLTSESGRKMLSTVRSVIVDEIHALADNKRGAHLALSLERLQALVTQPLTRIGLSATQRPIERVAKYLVGRDQACTIIDTGHVRERDLAIEMPKSPLEAVMAAEVWSEVYDRLAALISEHRSTLIFVNTRRLAERAARFLSERLGEDVVTAHHGSLAKEHRLDAEQRLKAGRLGALVATASMELGIDIGDVDLVCQIGSPRSIAALIQRVGRSGHAVGATPKGRLFPTSRDDLVECVALLRAVQQDKLDELKIPSQPVDVLAQQIVAEAGSLEWRLDDLYACFTRASPYSTLSREAFDQVIQMLADGFSTRRGRRSAYLHLDAVNKVIRGRRGARLSALTNGGAIPEQFDYDVILEPEGLKIGTLNEDFAFESLAGDIFQLGNTAYRIIRVERNVVRVEDAKGQPPNIPFWFGEAPGRSDELSLAVSQLRHDIEQHLTQDIDATVSWLTSQGFDAVAAQQVTAYLGAAHAALGTLPKQSTVVIERFFDEAGDMHLVVHSPFGSRINRAWGLALRKKFCQRFNFELQAAALEDTIVLSLGATHSFDLEDIKDYLSPNNIRDVLVQAILQVPMFGTRWRWVANIALAVKRNRNGKRIPAQFQRSDAEDLVALVFPDQLACQDNVVGAREIPDHPLVNQTLHDCLNEVMDVDGFERLLKRLVAGEIKVIVRDLNAPSPLAQEILSARPYAFLDDAPAEERRTLAVQARGFMDIESARDLGRLDQRAIEKVCDEAWPEPRNADELHDALVVMGFLSENEGQQGRGKSWVSLFESLIAEQRATRLRLSSDQTWWIAAERLAQVQALYSDVILNPGIEPVATLNTVESREQALVELLRSRMEGLGPVKVSKLATDFALDSSEIEFALMALQNEGFVIKGRFSNHGDEEWCERRLLARIHRYTIGRLRKEIEPVSAQDFMRFLLAWHRVNRGSQGDGVDALVTVVEQLEGFEAPVAAWESELLPSRLWGYTPSMLDELNFSGRIRWARLTPRKKELKAENYKRSRVYAPIRNTPISFLLRQNVSVWREWIPATGLDDFKVSSTAGAVVKLLQAQGALFFDEIVELTGALPSQLEQALGDLIAQGLITSDSFNGLRGLLVPSVKRPSFGRSARGKRRRSVVSVEHAGRWSLIRQRPVVEATHSQQSIEHIAMTLLRRYGVVFRVLMEREAHWLPPWRELLRVYHRLEAQGHIRGGRFVSGFTGEQFALPDAVGALREMRNKLKDGEFVVINATDPLNLVGSVLPGQRVSSLVNNRILYRDGVCVAVQLGDRVELKDNVNDLTEWNARNALLRRNTGEVSVGERLVQN